MTTQEIFALFAILHALFTGATVGAFGYGVYKMIRGNPESALRGFVWGVVFGVLGIITS